MRPLNLPYLALNLLYWIALVVPPILLGFAWLGWFQSPPPRSKMANHTFIFGPVCWYCELRVVVGLGGLAAVSLQFRILENPRPG